MRLHHLKKFKILIFVILILFCASMLLLSPINKIASTKTEEQSTNITNQARFPTFIKPNQEQVLQSPIFVSPSNSSCFYPEISSVVQFFQYGETEKFCKNLVAFGGSKLRNEKYTDGEKMVCLDKEFNIKQGNCTVLSFGIANDWSFDDAMGQFGCKVFSFDPTISMEDFNRSENIRFFNLGLGDAKKVQQFSQNTGKVDRYESILTMLNLSKQEIDYLKIDIEGSEINFFKDIFLTSHKLLKNVKQIGMEIHPGRPGNSTGYYVKKNSIMYQLWHGMKHLECAGFKILSFEKNLAGGNPYRWRNRNETNCYEIVWGKIPDATHSN